MNETILITGCGGHFIRDTIRSYRAGKRNLHIIGVASSLDESIRPELDEYYQVPVSTDVGYIKTLLSICSERNVDVLIPNVDEELMDLSESESLFQNIGTRVSIAPRGALAKASDKIQFMQFLKSEGLPHPEFATFRTVDGFVKAVGEIGYPDKPVVIKMSGKAGSVGVRILDPTVDMFELFATKKPGHKYMTFAAMKEMLESRENLPEMLAQEYLPGQEYSTDILADHGREIYITGRMNTVCENSIPMESVLTKNEAAYQISREIVWLLGLDGNVGIDFIFNRDGTPIPIEVNPRITATISLSTAAGVNLAYLQVERLLGGKLPDVKPAYGTEMTRRRIPMYCAGDGIEWLM